MTDVRARHTPLFLLMALVWCAFPTAIAVGLIGGNASPILAVLPALLGLGLFAGIASRRVWTADGRLYVRNFFSTHAYEAPMIAGFEVADRMDLAFRDMRQRVVYVHLVDGRKVRLSATKRNYYKFFSYT